MIQYLRLFLIIALFSALWGCDSSTAPKDDNSSVQEVNQSGQPIPLSSGSSELEFGGVMASISFQFQTVPGFPAAEFVMGYAYFNHGSDAGEVKINNQALKSEGSSGSSWYTSFSQTSPSSLQDVNFNGTQHNWTVSGKGDIPALNASVTSPLKFNLTSPLTGATITKSSGMNITWSGGSAQSADSMLVMLLDLSNSKTILEQGLPNNGQYTIDSGKLKDFSGDAFLQVVKYRYSITETGNFYYSAVAEIVNQASIIIE